MAQEFYDFEDRKYVEPTLSRDEQLGFIDRLREMENKDLQKIATDTHNLGSDLPSNLGGLSAPGTTNSIGVNGADTGSAGIWRNRFERPQVNALVSDLKATAQASALNTALNNMLNQYKNRYNQAARLANKLEDSGGGDDDDPYNTNVGDPLEQVLNSGRSDDDHQKGSYIVRGSDGSETVIDVWTNKQGKITGVDTGMFSYGAEDETGTTGAEYIQNLKDRGYTFWNSDGNKVDIDAGF